MADNKHNHDSIERLFLEKSEAYHIPFREEDWLKLEKKLDVRDAQRIYRQRVRWIAAASLLLISLLGYLTFENRMIINDLRDQIAEMSDTGSAPQLDPQPDPEPDEVSPGTDPMTDPEEDFQPGIEPGAGIDPDANDIVDGIRPDEMIPPSLEEHYSEIIEGLQDPGDVIADRAPPPLAEEIPRLPGGIVGDDDHETETGAMQITYREIPDPADRAISGIKRFGDEGQDPAYPYIRQPDISSLVSAHKTSEPEPTVSLPAISEEGLAVLEDPRTSRFAAGIMMSPDFSTVGSVSNFYDPGYKIGVSLEYSITARLAISTGIVYSNVRYAAGGDAYGPPPELEQGIPFNDMTGECRLLDIPISLKYQVLNFDRSRIFATAGISSYFMLNERYEFRFSGYENYPEPDQVSYWEEQTGTSHWLSNAGFSVGYERDLDRHWSLRAEPFVRVPVNEVGWANVRLFSMGSFLSINYRM